MHEHRFKRSRAIGKWTPSQEPGILIAYDKWINLCECGDQKEIRTHPKGIWQKASTRNIERVGTYPARWLEVLKDLIKSRIKEEPADVAIQAEAALKVSGMGWNEFEGFISAFVKDGVIEKFEPYPKGLRGSVKIVFRAEVIEQLKAPLGLDLIDKEREKIDRFFEAWEYPPQGIESPARNIARVVDEMKKKWVTSGRAIVPLLKDKETTMKSLYNYTLLLETLRGIFSAALSREMLSMRELSVSITGDSKGIENIRPYLRDILGDLSHYGICEHSPLVFCRLPVIGNAGDKTIDLEACDDYVSLTLRTAKLFRPRSFSMKKIILVENLTPFENLARNSNKMDSTTGILFLSGYPPGHVREFVKMLIEFSPFEGLIWCDLDPDGVEIALTAAKWFKKSSWRPLFMEKDFLSSSKTKPLTDNDHKKLSSLKKQEDTSVFNSLLLEMERLGLKVEQEAQKLPPDIQI